MRALLISLLIGSCGLYAQAAPDTLANGRCIERLELPAYPKLADMARLQGTLTATVALTRGGSIEKLTVGIGGASEVSKNKFFQPAVEEAIRGSVFRRDCDGKSVILIFNFVLGEKLDPRMSFGYPNRFWISAPAKLVNP